MDNVENHLKKQGVVPKMKVDDIVVDSSSSMQIIDMITKRFKIIGRVNEGNEFLRLLRKVFFPQPDDGEIEFELKEWKAGLEG